MEQITWHELTQIEPRLNSFLQDMKKIKDPGDTPSFCANAVWYGDKPGTPNYRGYLYRLVGWEAESKDPRIRTSEAFDVAYEVLYNALPDCRNCNCM